jgi:hypothetical protein
MNSQANREPSRSGPRTNWIIKTDQPADKPYGSGVRGSKYQGQRGPTLSRYFENFR